MERAAGVFSKWVAEKHPAKRYVLVCGMGNNGGDGLAATRILHNQYNSQVRVIIIKHGNTSSPDFDENLSRLAPYHIQPETIAKTGLLPTFDKDDIVIDALLGSGLNRPVTKGILAEVIEWLNALPNTIISIDIPSGLFADKSSKGNIVCADDTLSFEQPKSAFLFSENAQYVKSFDYRSIGLDKSFIARSETDYFFIDDVLAKSFYQPGKKFDHKGTYGHTLLAAGSKGKLGAAVLCTKAALKSGAGLVTCHTICSGSDVLHTAVPEAMLSFTDHEQWITTFPKNNAYNVAAIGPGMGKNALTAGALEKFIESFNGKLVLDADALNIIAENPTLLDRLPANTILTPHPKEFERLFGSFDDDFVRVEFLSKMCREKNRIVVLKGAHTAVGLTSGRVYFNSTGNCGMSTAGSGDVLTGIIAGLLSRGYLPAHAALLGVYLHGLSGDIATETLGYESLIASDIIENLFLAFKTVKP